MELLFTLCKHDNKENIPPKPISGNAAAAAVRLSDVVKSSTTATNVSKRVRKPLRDITHLFNDSDPNQSASSSLVHSHTATNSRKRKPVYYELLDNKSANLFKSMRKDFR